MVKKTLVKDQIAEIDNKYKRALADYQNLERRFKEQEGQVVKFANATLIEKLLSIIDHLLLAQKHIQDKGLQMVIDQFEAILVGEGVEKMTTDGAAFDPNTMDCSEVVEGEKDLVIETVSPGYLMFGKVIRPAKVKVGSGVIQNVL